MNTTVLNSIRTSQGFSRSVAYLIIVAIVGVVLERIIYYSLEKTEIIERENVVEKINRVAPHKARQLGLPQTPTQAQIERSKSNDTKLSEAVISVQDTLDVLAYELLNDGDPEKAQDKLDQLYSSLLDYDKQAIRDFAETEAHIEKHQLADIIKQRHQDMVLNYRTEMDALLANMRAIQATDGTDDKLDVVLTAIKQLESKQLKRSQQPFDPNNLPNRSLQPNEENKPKLTPEQFAQAGLFSNPYPQYAALGDFTYDKLPGATNPAYLGESVEIKLTQAIRDQAAELNHDPVQIYNWVRNNIIWIPSWGAMQEADITLGSKRGNALDIASLHIALLRASQIPARYVHGTIEVPADKFMNWAGGFTNIEAAARYASSGGIPLTGVVVGGKVVKVRMEHIWVEAAADFHPSRAAINIDADSWVEMDASFKQYEHLEGMDVAAIADLDNQNYANDFVDSGTFNEQESWVSGFDSTILLNAQEQAQIAFEEHITANFPDYTVGDVIGKKTIIVQNAPGLPSSLPNAIKIIGTSYAALPTPLQVSVTITLGRDILNQPVKQITLPWAEVNNHKLTLSYNPATSNDEAVLLSYLPEGEITDTNQLPSSLPGYLINVIPELRLGGEVVSQGQPLPLGNELNLEYSLYLPSYGSRSYSSPVIAGSYQALMTIGGSISINVLNQFKSKITDTKIALELGDLATLSTISRDDILGDIFFVGNLGYFSQYTSLTHAIGLQQSVHQELLASIGTYGYVPKVIYLFGLPRAVGIGGVEMDLDSISTFTGSNAGDKTQLVNFIQRTGALSSALEHAVPEQMFSSPTDTIVAISSVKALSMANAQGQRIYRVTRENQFSTLPNINHSNSTMNEIRNALAIGKIVITHTDSISTPYWSGAGYIILDPENADGAYKIGGGLNGSSGNMGDVSLVAGSLAGGGDAYADELTKNDLPFDEDLPKIKLAKTIALMAKFLGALSIIIDIYYALDGLEDGTVTISQVVGRLSVLLFGYAVGNYVVAGIAATFFPVAAAIVATAFIATLTIVLALFSALYFSNNKILINRKKEEFA